MLALVLLVAVLISAMTLTTAQEGDSLNYGSVVLGNLDAQTTSAQYTFTGIAGDRVTVTVSGATAGMNPNVTLLSPTGETLASNDDSLFDFSRNAVLSYRLPAAGTYSLVVSGTAGTFLLTLDANTAPNMATISLNQPVTVNLPLTEPGQVFAFNTNPTTGTTLLIDASPLGIDAYIEVVDFNGRRIASLRGDLDNACLSFAPGDEVRFGIAPNVTGSLTLTLGQGTCLPGMQPQPPVATFAPPVFQVTPINGACTIGSASNFNVRSGPGLQYAILFVWAARLSKCSTRARRRSVPLRRPINRLWAVRLFSGWIISNPCSAHYPAAFSATMTNRSPAALPPSSDGKNVTVAKASSKAR